MTQEELQATGFIVVDRDVVATTYKDYLKDYGMENVCSPRGVEDRLHIRENEEEPTFEVWDWVGNGRKPRFIDTYQTEEEANLFMWERAEWYVINKNWDAPCFYGTEAEAITDLADRLEKAYEVIERYLSFCAYCRKKEAERKKEWSRQYEAQKAALNIEIEKEAALIEPDSEFQEALKKASKLSSEAKSEALSAAFITLLNRLGHGKIKSDFWKVFRIVSKK